jgi:hypothetical protein
MNSRSFANGNSAANASGIDGQSGCAVGVHTLPGPIFGENWELLTSGRTTFWELI